MWNEKGAETSEMANREFRRRKRGRTEPKLPCQKKRKANEIQQKKVIGKERRREGKSEGWKVNYTSRKQ